jgi:hypothetical protein
MCTLLLHNLYPATHETFESPYIETTRTDLCDYFTNPNQLLCHCVYFCSFFGRSLFCMPGISLVIGVLAWRKIQHQDWEWLCFLPFFFFYIMFIFTILACTV